MSNDNIIIIPKDSLSNFENDFKICLNQFCSHLCDILGIERNAMVINSEIDKCLLIDTEDYELIRIHIEFLSSYLYDLLKVYASK